MKYRKIFIGMVVFPLLFAGCQKLNNTITNLSGGSITIIGHGGGGIPGISTATQLNSLEGMVRAVQDYNTGGVETDVQLTSDSVLFMFHDDHLDDLSFCTGCINSYDAQTLSQCTFKQANDGDNTPESITPLESLISTFAQRPVHPLVFLDLHLPNSDCVVGDSLQKIYYQQTIRAIDRLIRKYNAASWVSIQSGTKDWLMYAKTNFPYMRILLDYARTQDDIDFAAKNKFLGVGAETQDFSADNVASAHKSGLYVQLYGANSQNDIVDAYNKAPDFFLADNIILAEKIVQAIQ